MNESHKRVNPYRVKEILLDCLSEDNPHLNIQPKLDSEKLAIYEDENKQMIDQILYHNCFITIRHFANTKENFCWIRNRNDAYSLAFLGIGINYVITAKDKDGNLLIKKNSQLKPNNVIQFKKVPETKLGEK